MAAGEPQQPDDNNSDRGQRQRARVAAWCEAIGAVLAIATLISSLLNAISAQQAVAMGLPAVLLTAGGLIAASTLAESDGGRIGFRAGLRVGTLLRKLRSAFRHRLTAPVSVSHDRPVWRPGCRPGGRRRAPAGSACRCSPGSG